MYNENALPVCRHLRRLSQILLLDYSINTLLLKEEEIKRNAESSSKES